MANIPTFLIRLQKPKNNNKKAGSNTARKQAHQGAAHFRNTEIQVTSISKDKFDIGLLQRPQQTKTPAQKAGIRKSIPKISVSDVRKEY